jgi:hypothetical protein
MNSQLEIVKKASILIERKLFIEAKQILLNFININKNVKIDLKLYYSLYLVFDGLNEVAGAKKYLEKCLKINKKNHIIFNNLANIYLKNNQVKEAEKFYLKSIFIKKDYLLAIVNLAILYQNTGNLENSKHYYLEAIKISPEQISIYFNLSRIDKHFIDQDKIEYLRSLMQSKKIGPSELAYGYFLLAEYEKKKKNFTLEIDYLKKGNKHSFESNRKNNIQTLNYWQNIISKNYKNFKFTNNHHKNDLKNFKPIFIIGLPRSGSTLLEVLLLSGNKNIRSLGESNIFNGIIANNLSSESKTDINLKYIEEKIIEILNNKNFDTKNKIFVDKSLENFFYIDVILKVFPKAVFIHTKRDIEDNIIAIYQQSLSKISWTHTLENIIDYIDNYSKISSYFNKKYPKHFFNVELVKLTNKPEETSKELYSFCDLKWTPKVLNNVSNSNILISTASNVQIREKIKKYDKEKYKPYKDLLNSFYGKYNWLN